MYKKKHRKKGWSVGPHLCMVGQTSQPMLKMRGRAWWRIILFSFRVMNMVKLF